MTRALLLGAALVFVAGCGTPPKSADPGETPDEDVLSAPQGLSAQALSASSVELSWTGTQDNPDGSEIHVERALFSSGPFEQIVVLDGTSTELVDPGLSVDLAYWYRVRSVWESEVTDWVGPVGQVLPPRAPDQLEADVVSEHQVDLTWSNPSNVADGFVIERRLSGGTFAELDEVASDELTYSDESVNGERTYEYRILAFNDGGESDYTATALATTPIASPTSLKAETPSSTELTLTWTDNSDIESGYHVASALDPGGPWTGFTLPADSTSTTVDGLNPGSTAYWRVNAVTSEGEESAFAGPLEVTMPP